MTNTSLVVSAILFLFSISTIAQNTGLAEFKDELPIAPQSYDEYGGQSQISFQRKAGSNEKVFSVLKKNKPIKPKRGLASTPVSKRKKSKRIRNRQMKKRQKKQGRAQVRSVHKNSKSKIKKTTKSREKSRQKSRERRRKK